MKYRRLVLQIFLHFFFLIFHFFFCFLKRSQFISQACHAVNCTGNKEDTKDRKHPYFAKIFEEQFDDQMQDDHSNAQDGFPLGLILVDLDLLCHTVITGRVMEFNLVRDDISTETVDAAYMIDRENGYIRISSFGAKTHKEFVAKLDSLRARGMKNLVLDLEGNGGGYLTAAVEIANEFLEKSSLVVYTEGRANPRYNYNAIGGGRFLKGNIAVIVDETSASAAEILAGAIQDWDRGVVVGRRSFGKGLVQRPFQMPDGSMIRLTIARYYTPTGRCIQKPYNDSIKYEEDLMRRYNSGEMSSADSIHFPDSLKVHTLRLNRPVYGGGGIMPDYFVPMDTTRYTAYHRALASKGSIVQASLRYLDENRKELEGKYKNVEDFDANFVVDDRYMALLKEQALKDSVELKGGEDELRKSLPELQKQLKMYIARDLWDMSDFIKIYNKYNDSFLKAYELVRSRKMDKVLLKK